MDNESERMVNSVDFFCQMMLSVKLMALKIETSLGGCFFRLFYSYKLLHMALTLSLDLSVKIHKCLGQCFMILSGFSRKIRGFVDVLLRLFSLRLTLGCSSVQGGILDMMPSYF